jgi:hypothetical protein
MKHRIQRLSHVSFLYRPENLTHAIERLEKVLGIHDFDGPYDLTDFGIAFCVSWTGGIELISPLVADGGGPYWGDLRTRGERLYALIFGVQDLGAAQDRAIGAGATPVSGIINCRTLAVKSSNMHFTRFHEVMIEGAIGVNLVLGQIEPK